MATYKVRLSPTVEECIDDYAAACKLADENAVYGAVVTDALGTLLYAPHGEVAATVLYHAKEVCDYIRDLEFVYGHAPINPVFNHNAKTVSCDRLVDWIYFKCGYMAQPVKHGKCVSSPGLTNWCIDNGFEKITSIEDLIPGDIIFTRASAAGDPLHTFVHAGKSAEQGMYYRYDAGKVERIRSTQPSCEPICDFMYAYRAPAVKPSFMPTLSFKYDGVPFSQLKTEARCEGNDITYTLPDGLELTVKYEFFPEYGVTKWTNYWHNPTDHVSGLVSELADCDITFPMHADAPRTRRNRQKNWEPTCMILHTTQGANVQDDDHMDIPVCMWEGDHHEASCTCGRSGMGMAPFFDAVEGGDRQKGILMAIGWTGQWKAQFDRGEQDFRMRHGVQDAHFRMNPGESFRTASTTVLVYTDGQVNAHNRWRRYIREVISPFAQSKGERGEQCPFSAIFWGGVSSESLIGRWEKLLEHKLPFNYCWVDAGWYEPLRAETTDGQTAEWGRTGSWEINQYFHPNGYRDVTDFLKSHGIKFQLWFEPERFFRSIKDWTGSLYYQDPNEDQVLTALNEDWVCDDVIEMVSGLIERIPVDCYRQDSNIFLDAFWRKADSLQENGEERKGTTEIHYINNLWRFWDALLERFPHLLIDNCAGGGHRIDIEMLSRSVPLWRSDYQCTWDCCPEANQNQNASAAWWYPYSGIGYGPTLGDLYSFRSAYTNGMTVRTWEHVDPEWEVGAMNEPMDFAKKYFDEYNGIRHYFAQDFYPLIPVSKENTAWSASQYHNSADDSGIVLAFRRAMCPYDRATVSLGGIDAGKTYEFTDLDTGVTTRYKGEDLARDGMTLIIDEKRKSMLLQYRAV